MAASTSRVCVLAFKTSKLNISSFRPKFSNVNCVSSRYISSNRHYSKDVTPATSKEEQDEFFEFAEDEDYAAWEKSIELKRDKSGLKPHHYNVLHGKLPHKEPVAWFHHSVRYKRRMLARYGLEANDAPLGIFWPTKKELQEQIEYENALRPDDLQTMVTRVTENRKAEELRAQQRQDEVAANFAKLGQWKQELAARIAKKTQAVIASQKKKERLVEEVRRHFGYNVDPREDRFKEMLEQKEKQEKKLEKDAKKKAKQDKMMQNLLSKSAELTAQVATPKPEETTPSESSKK